MAWEVKGSGSIVRAAIPMVAPGRQVRFAQIGQVGCGRPGILAVKDSLVAMRGRVQRPLQAA